MGASSEEKQRPRHADPPKSTLDRRSFIGALGLAGIGVATRATSAAAQTPGVAEVGVLVDTTKCAGCRMCEVACAQANGLPMPDHSPEALAQERTMSETQRTVVNRYETDKGTVSVKKQCMHCVQPACASACLTRAMLKTHEGPVVWRGNKCMGCRFCMVSCPFNVPKFEYHSANPKIEKCTLCWERLNEGQEPACVANCPMKALTFGKRTDLLREARKRIVENPDRYIDHIYGEQEVGGTSWMYLSAVPFEQLRFRTDLGTEAYPTLTKNFLYAVPVVLTLVPGFLLAVSNATKRGDESSEGET
jgi:formate dehydrogenase iron-sulfur subunit